ncbi:MAG: hypothetical protein KKA05_08340 [Alphaproteobacteria bacterium]|nr:hypothetical protein [Alphaproteobacteria bacterium]MBU0858387.1 hypothetical protein [Alphaproteobacteria bacterium]
MAKQDNIMATPLFETINTLLRDMDIEGLIVSGSPDDEYETEAETLARAFSMLTGEDFNRDNLIEIFCYVWADSFELDDDEVDARMEKIEAFVDGVLKDANAA